MSPTENLVDMNDALAKSVIFFFLKRKKTWDEHIFYQNLYVQSRTCWRLLNLWKKEFLLWNEREKRKRSITISSYKVEWIKKNSCASWLLPVLETKNVHLYSSPVQIWRCTSTSGSISSRKQTLIWFFTLACIGPMFGDGNFMIRCHLIIFCKFLFDFSMRLFTFNKQMVFAHNNQILTIYRQWMCRGCLLGWNSNNWVPFLQLDFE